MGWILQIALTNAVTVTLLFGGVIVISKIVRRPAVTHLLCVLLLVKLLTPPIITVPVPWNPDWVQAWWSLDDAGSKGIERPLAPRPADVLAQPAPGVHQQFDRAATSRMKSLDDASGDWFPSTARENLADAGRALVRWSGVIWLLGAIAALSMLMGSAIRFCRKVSRRVVHDDAFAEMAAEVNPGRKRPGIQLVDDGISPMLFGFGPCCRVLFPRELWDQLDDGARRSLMLHEVAHYRRKDHWVRILEAVCQVVYWWHPLLPYLRRAIEQSEEACCDAVVLQDTESRQYAEAIVAALEYLAEVESRKPRLACGMSGVPVLRHRLTQIMRRSVNPKLPLSARIAVTLLAAVMLMLHPSPVRVASATPATVSAEFSRSEEEDIPDLSVVDEPIRPSAALEESLPPPPQGWWDFESKIQSTRIVSRDGHVTLEVDTPQHVQLKTGRAHSRTFDLSPYGLTCATYVDEGRMFVSGSVDGAVRLWKIEPEPTFFVLGTHAAEIRTMAVDGKRQRVATGCREGVIRMWDLKRDRLVLVWSGQEGGVAAMAFSPDDRKLLVAWGDFRRPTRNRISEIDLENLTEHVALENAPPTAALKYVSDDHISVLDWGGKIQRLHAQHGFMWPTDMVNSEHVRAAAFSPDSPWHRESP